METLSSAERELVSLGAALGSNCVPCIEYHIPEARKAGLCDRKIRDAIRIADKVRQVPARKVLATALGMLPEEVPAERVGHPAEPAGPAAVGGTLGHDCSADPAPAGVAERPCCG